MKTLTTNHSKPKQAVLITRAGGQLQGQPAFHVSHGTQNTILPYLWLFYQRNTKTVSGRIVQRYQQKNICRAACRPKSPVY